MARHEKRVERYNYLITLGFTASEARAMRDRSGGRIDAQLNERRKNLERTESVDRNERERQQLTRLRASRREGRVSRDGKILKQHDRQENFEMWSGFAGFPADMAAIAQDINDARGEDENDSFGYRQLYHMYVEREDMEEAKIITEERDT